MVMMVIALLQPWGLELARRINMTTYHVKFVGVAIIAMLLIGHSLIAQPQRRSERPGRLPRERIEEFKKLKLIEVVDLEEELAVRFFAKYNKHEKKQQAVHREMKETVDRIEKMLQENAGEAEFEKAFARLQELERKIDGERQRFLDELRQILTVQQVGKLIVFERNFAKRIQEIMQGRRGERWRER